MAKARMKLAETGPELYVNARLPYDVYQQVRELALRHDVTIGEATRMLLDKVRIETEDKLRADLEKVKAEAHEAIAELENQLAEAKKKAAELEGELRKAKRSKIRPLSLKEAKRVMWGQYIKGSQNTMDRLYSLGYVVVKKEEMGGGG